MAQLLVCVKDCRLLINFILRELLLFRIILVNLLQQVLMVLPLCTSLGPQEHHLLLLIFLLKLNGVVDVLRGLKSVSLWKVTRCFGACLEVQECVRRLRLGAEPGRCQ